MLDNFILSTLIDIGKTLSLVCSDSHSTATKSYFNFDDYYEVVVDYQLKLVSIPKYQTNYAFSELDIISEIEFLRNLIYQDLKAIELTLN